MPKYNTNPDLRAALSKLRADRKLTNPAVAKLFGVSTTFISKYINDSLDHDPKGFEAVAADTIRAIENRLDQASQLFETSVSRAMAGRIDIARRTGHSCLFGSPAGEGKTSGGVLYQLSNPSSIYFKLSGTDRDSGAINSHLWTTLRKSDWSDNVKRWTVMVDAVKGSQRAIICDNAHRLDTSGQVRWTSPAGAIEAATRDLATAARAARDLGQAIDGAHSVISHLIDGAEVER